MTAPSYDYLIVGAGLFGAVCARELTDAGKKVLVIERREHIAGNCYTQNMAGINVHMYGPHIFHTSNDEVWKYVNRFATFNNFVYRPMVRYHGKLYSFPINLLTMYQIFGVQTPEEAKRKLEEVRVRNSSPKNMEEFALDAVGEEIYETFIKGYTTKQWGRTPDQLPADIFKRLVVRTNFDTNYYRDTHQGIPIGGYTKMIDNMLQGVEVLLGVDYFKARERWDGVAPKVIYTGPIDRYFQFVNGELEYINMRFDHKEVDTPDFQGVAAINHTEIEVPYTRIVEHKHFEFANTPTTVITHEYSLGVGIGLDKYYPIGDKKNLAKLEQYKSLAAVRPDVIFGGRLAEYKYYDMHQVIANALETVKKELA
jgi:UDP-galactopyranose mutase